MNKKRTVLLLIISIISIFSFKINVNAKNADSEGSTATGQYKSLTCIYKKGAITDPKRVVIQKSNGEIVYFENKKDEEITGSNWKTKGSISQKHIELLGGPDFYDNSNHLTKCPGAINGSSKKLTLYSKKSNEGTAEALEKSYDYVVTKIGNNSVVDAKNDSSNLARTEKDRELTCLFEKGGLFKEWGAYKVALIQFKDGSLTLLKNKDDVGIDKPGWELANGSIGTIDDSLKDNNGHLKQCPKSKNTRNDGNGIVDFYANESDGATGLEQEANEVIAPPGFESVFENIDFNPVISFTDPDSISSCKDLFGNDIELINMLHTIVLVFKISVPILLIVLGTLDFGKAVLAQEESDMKKAQNKFIKRIIIAIVILLIPTLLKVILDIANSVWGSNFIDSTFCGIL